MTKQDKIKLMNSCSGFNMHNGIVISDISDELCVVDTFVYDDQDRLTARGTFEIYIMK